MTNGNKLVTWNWFLLEPSSSGWAGGLNVPWVFEWSAGLMRGVVSSWSESLILSSVDRLRRRLYFFFDVEKEHRLKFLFWLRQTKEKKPRKCNFIEPSLNCNKTYLGSPRAKTFRLQIGQTRRFFVSHGSMHLLW